MSIIVKSNDIYYVHNKRNNNIIELMLEKAETTSVALDSRSFVRCIISTAEGPRNIGGWQLSASIHEEFKGCLKNVINIVWMKRECNFVSIISYLSSHNRYNSTTGKYNSIYITSWQHNILKLAHIAHVAFLFIIIAD